MIIPTSHALSLGDALLNGRLLWWRHDIESFPHYWSFVRGTIRSTNDFPHKGRVMQSFTISFVDSLNNSLKNSRATGDLRHHGAHVTSL